MKSVSLIVIINLRVFALLVFIKHEICIPHEAIEAVMHSQDGAAIKFVENMYTLLTNRSYVK